MARYLSPAKTCLLALVELYVEDAVPHDGALPVLCFITSHLIDVDVDVDVASFSNPRSSRDRWQKARDIVGLIASINDFEQLLSPYSAATGLPGRRLWDVFLHKIWSIDSLHALHQFFDRLRLLLAKTKDELSLLAASGWPPPTEGTRLSRNSPFGTFVRRSQLEFGRLRFSDVGELWKDFVKYRQPTASAWRRRNPAAGPLSFDSVLLAGEHEWGAATADIAAVAYGDVLDENAARRLPASTDDLEILLEFQIDQMQRFGVRVPVKMRNEYSSLLKESYAVPSTSHYLRCLDAWRSGDYPTSYDYLHQYFDYTMHSSHRPFYQYALLTLAVLQAEFGCYKEAVDAMLETVSTARENRDMTCLNYALNWLFHFGQAHPHLVKELESNSMLGSGKETLAFLRVKAKEAGMFSLWSAALLSEAKLCLANGDSIATAVEYMVRSSQVLVERNIKYMVASQTALSIALWDRLGSASTTLMACRIFLMCHAPHSRVDDSLNITARLASLQAGRGQYDEAMSLLENIDANALRTWKMNQYWRRYRGLLKVLRNLHRNDLDGADYLLSQLLQTQPDDLEADLVSRG
ncbi:putative anaphase-promoting complex protein [Phaeoacremonium minimum UCRPA7]|uniref:Anaphase-promoting complex subunit 5 n=1 Tax=Phaeoacremonium minimum (strain UCR-PA7) TaxID=1286976 RepID=R8BK37_PHAM7|nr:putative anaphase-promoting complex protein [Phaeoacremonium minimum UCRPA7]EON99676.1 putative anaphase-promoting complex protein [Phaeoacremonium minimum UCRPA7]